MTNRRRGRRIDDWFRPVNADGTMSNGRRQVTPRDRRFMWGTVLLGLLALTAIFMRFDTGRAFAVSGGIIGVMLVQLFILGRTRGVGFSTERQVPSSAPPRSRHPRSRVATGGVEPPEPADQQLLDLLQARDGLLTYVLLDNGQRLPVHDIAWGYGMGDEYAHVTTNCSPPVRGRPVDFFVTSQVTRLLDGDQQPLDMP